VVTRFDAIIIGTGQAGPALAARLDGAGMKVAVIERAKFGGTCVNTGCIPTKTMVASAYVAHMARRAGEYGVTTGAVGVDMKRVKERKDGVAGDASRGVEKWLRGLKNVTVFEAHARFEGPRTVAAGSKVLEADRIFINVGGRALVPDLPGLDKVPYLTNSSMMDLDFIPGHLIVIGGSYIGLEFGQMYRRFGAKVTVIEKGPRLIAREDEDISDAIRAILESEGMDVRLDAECIGVRQQGGEILVSVDCAAGGPPISGTHLLLAIGRVPNTGDLGLDQAGVRLDERGYVQVNDELQTSVPGIWALGDCNGRGAFTHTSYNDYEIVAANVLGTGRRKVTDRIAAYALFTDPPLGRAGMTTAEAKKSGRRLLVGHRLMSAVGRAVEKGEAQGFMKAVVDADTGEILGAAILGTSGDEAIHCLLDVMYSKQPYTTVTHAVHIHPTVSELLPTMLGELKPI
jgi:pyruvate/2-oxoglutarate dehydrogenase complex dihydrolipoamide dehydrogenase (E3) component